MNKIPEKETIPVSQYYTHFTLILQLILNVIKIADLKLVRVCFNIFIKETKIIVHNWFWTTTGTFKGLLSAVESFQVVSEIVLSIKHRMAVHKANILYSSHHWDPENYVKV